MEPKNSIYSWQGFDIWPYFEPNESIPYHHIILLRLILILSSHLCLCTPSDIFTSSFRTTILNVFLVSNVRFICPVLLIFLNLIIWRKITDLLIMQFSPAFCYSLPFIIRYSQSPVSRYPHSLFFNLGETPNFTFDKQIFFWKPNTYRLKDENYDLPGCNNVLTGTSLLTFRRNVLLPSSG
jgi:hypothetical protein